MARASRTPIRRLAGLVLTVIVPGADPAIADHTGPHGGLGVYRFWRGLGYALGAVLAGLVAQGGLSSAVIAGGRLPSPPGGSPRDG